MSLLSTVLEVYVRLPTHVPPSRLSVQPGSVGSVTDGVVWYSVTLPAAPDPPAPPLLLPPEPPPYEYVPAV